MFYERFVKRSIDFSCALVMLILASPIMLITAILVKLKLGSPVLFVQERPGYHEKTMRMVKFRSMTNERDANGVLLPDEVRLTRFGRFLRKTSLDELPELFNILKGDMAFIGPRPLLISYLKYYNEDQHKRHNVRPGFSCISEIEGRNTLSWTERLKLDTYYAEHISFKLDATIFFKTIFVVLLQKGAPDATESHREPLEIELPRENAKLDKSN